MDIQKALLEAERSIKKDINNWIVRFAKNNEVSIVEARKMLNNDELKEFKWDVKEFIKYGEENALNQEYMKELENASARFHISRLEAIELSIRNEFEKAYKIQDDKIRQNVLETYDDRYYRTCYEVQSKFGIGFDVSGVDTDKVKKLISKPWASDNKTFSDRVWTKKNEMIDTLRSQLIRTCATGGNIQDAVNSMMSFVSKDVKNARYAATRLLQTETAFFSSVSEKKALKDLDVEQYEILATLDSKTSPICQEMDGQVFKLSEYEIGATAPPFHVNCRSTTCPHFDDEYGERVARDRAGNTYMVPGDMTYKEWKAKQDEDIKRGATTSTNMGANSAPKDFRNLQKQGVKSNMDSNTNTDDSQIKYNDITDKWIEKTKDGSYAECDSITVNGKTYKVGDNGVILNLNNRTSEIEIAKALAEKYGKEVIMLPEISGSNVNIKTADLMVNGKLVEIKTLSASGPNTIKNAIKRAKGQANDIIINIGETKLTTDEILDTIQKQFNNPQCRHMEHCIIMKDGKVIKVFEQKKVGTAAILKYDVVPTVSNITTKPLKSQLKNKEKGGKIYIRKAKVVDGKDLVGEIEYKGLLQAYYHGDPNALYAIDEVVEKQGFNGLPTIINDENELKKLTNADTLLGERTIRANKLEDFEKFKDDLLNNRFYINCATGGAQYGQGMYFAGDYTKGKIKADKWQHEIDQYSGNAPFQKTYWLTLDKNIKKIDVNDIKKEYGKQAIKKLEKVWSKEKMTILKNEYYGTIGYDSNNTKPTGESYEKYMELFRKYKQQGKLKELRQIENEVVDFLSKDVGVMATEMGYDMIEAKGHGTTGSYNVLLNRTKLIIIDKDIKSEDINELFMEDK